MNNDNATEFDGKTAKRSVIERWFNETREWVGSNFVTIPTSSKALKFANNVFNYTHDEENSVSNSNDRIILDYGAYTIHPHQGLNGAIATYELGIWKRQSNSCWSLWGEFIKQSEFCKFFPTRNTQACSNEDSVCDKPLDTTQMVCSTVTFALFHC